VEHARHVLGIEGAAHAEYGETSERVVVTPLLCDLTDTTIDVSIRPGSRCAELHGGLTARERVTCRYGLDQTLHAAFETSGLPIVGVDATGGARLVERTDHPFFVGSLYLPQFAPQGDGPHALIAGFTRAARMRSGA
jgi:CTP synthase (UTP-ammonia lyase)